MKYVRYYVVGTLHRMGIHRFCRRTFEALPDPFALYRPEHAYWLDAGRPPKETHS